MGCCISAHITNEEKKMRSRDLPVIEMTVQAPEIFADLETENDMKGRIAVDHVFMQTREVYGQPPVDLEPHRIDWASEHKIYIKQRPNPSHYPAFQVSTAPQIPQDNDKVGKTAE
ncbi:hypothetical protein M3Y94_00135500 [Aphelenchoides besseyi]|nr:hypothetical protein M3Y94_00135500 [Aphelenchoides besseyi]KAI6237301.1 hypothetical protein M3Y95_00250600 [Aphelenchoides besseyi]